LVWRRFCPGTKAGGTGELDANLLQLMRGTLYPASNVLFAAQEDLSKQPKVAEADQARRRIR